MDDRDSRGLLKSILGLFARKQPERSTPASLKSQALDAWVRTDAYLQHETNDFDDYEPAQVHRTLTTFENLVHHDSGLDSAAVRTFHSSISHHFSPYFAIMADQRTIAAGLEQRCTIPKAAGCLPHDSATRP